MPEDGSLPPPHLLYHAANAEASWKSGTEEKKPAPGCAFFRVDRFGVQVIRPFGANPFHPGGRGQGGGNVPEQKKPVQKNTRGEDLGCADFLSCPDDPCKRMIQAKIISA